MRSKIVNICVIQNFLFWFWIRFDSVFVWFFRELKFSWICLVRQAKKGFYTIQAIFCVRSFCSENSATEIKPNYPKLHATMIWAPNMFYYMISSFSTEFND